MSGIKGIPGHLLNESAVDRAVEMETRRQFFARGARGLGSLALATMLGEKATAGSARVAGSGLATLPHFAP